MPLSAAEQYLLELINRARLDPLGEAARYGVDLNEGLDAGRIGDAPLQVLAPNGSLSEAAESHSLWMLETNTFAHSGDEGSSAGVRMRDAGYVFAGAWEWAENLAWAGTTGTIDLEAAVLHHHEGLYRSSGHRANTFSANVREIGLAQVEGDYTLNGTTYSSSMLTENFSVSGEDVFITGVAYKDTDGDGFYSIGEGQTEVTLAVASAQDTTSAAGGYAIAIAPRDAATVRVDIGGETVATVLMDVSQGNGKLDVVTDTRGDMSLNLSVDATLLNGIGDGTLLGAGDLSLRGNNSRNVLTGNDGDNYLTGMRGRDYLYGEDGNDVIVGGRGKDRLYGGNGDDDLTGGSSRDRLFGQSGDDILNASNGRDALWGGRGDDVLDGGRGNDKLVGGSGADTFIFNHGDDRITDFDADVDHIEIAAQLLGDADLRDLMVVENGDVVIYFDGGHSLTIDDHTDTSLVFDHISVA